MDTYLGEFFESLVRRLAAAIERRRRLAEVRDAFRYQPATEGGSWGGARAIVCPVRLRAYAERDCEQPGTSDGKR